jgi:hypothetical protein
MPLTRRTTFLVTAGAILAALGLILGGCSGSSSSSGAAAGEKPTIKITSPAEGATLPPGDLTVQVQVSHFELVDKLGEKPVKGQGHIHYFLDTTPPTAQGQPAIPKGGTFAPSTELSHTFTDVGPGQHMLAVELVQNNHTPLDPAVVDSVTVTVQPAGGMSGTSGQ